MKNQITRKKREVKWKGDRGTDHKLFEVAVGGMTASKNLSKLSLTQRLWFTSAFNRSSFCRSIRP
jgi:hypothetical protein